MGLHYLNNKSSVLEFRSAVRAAGLPVYKGSDLGRDSIVRYCLESNLGMVSEQYPSNLVEPAYEEFMDRLDIENKSPGDYEEYHNNKFVIAFSRALGELGYKSIKVYYECFEEEPRARCYDIEIDNLPLFLERSEVPIYFLDDTLFFSPDFKYSLCIFHHEALEFFGFGGDAREVYNYTIAGIRT